MADEERLPRFKEAVSGFVVMTPEQRAAECLRLVADVERMSTGVGPLDAMLVVMVPQGGTEAVSQLVGSPEQLLDYLKGLVPQLEDLLIARAGERIAALPGPPALDVRADGYASAIRAAQEWLTANGWDKDDWDVGARVKSLTTPDVFLVTFEPRRRIVGGA